MSRVREVGLYELQGFRDKVRQQRRCRAKLHLDTKISTDLHHHPLPASRALHARGQPTTSANPVLTPGRATCPTCDGSSKLRVKRFVKARYETDEDDKIIDDSIFTTKAPESEWPEELDSHLYPRGTSSDANILEIRSSLPTLSCLGPARCRHQSLILETKQLCHQGSDEKRCGCNGWRYAYYCL